MTKPYTPLQLLAILRSCKSGAELSSFQEAYLMARPYLPLGTHLVISVVYKSKLNRFLL